MKLPLAFHPEVRDDIDSAHAWYEGQREGYGNVFLSSFGESLKRIEENPELYGLAFKNVRAAPIEGFPYVVYYRLEPKRTAIAAVQHGHRNRSNWRKRLS